MSSYASLVLDPRDPVRGPTNEALAVSKTI